MVLFTFVSYWEVVNDIYILSYTYSWYHDVTLKWLVWWPCFCSSSKMIKFIPRSWNFTARSIPLPNMCIHSVNNYLFNSIQHMINADKVHQLLRAKKTIHLYWITQIELSSLDCNNYVIILQICCKMNVISKIEPVIDILRTYLLSLITKIH